MTRTDIAGTLPAPPPVSADAGWALFLDVDGTLLDLAPTPDDVEVDPGLGADLARLHARLGGAVAVLSGRPLSQLDALLGWQGRAAAGLHGAEVRTPDGGEHRVGGGDAFVAARSLAITLLAEAPGVTLEDKGQALALHFRQTPTASGAAARIARTLLEAAGADYVIQRGDHVIELKPAGVDKGQALAALMQHATFRTRTPWVLGDDLTDEDAFRRANALGGTSVIVGARRPTAAHHALATPAAVRAWLHDLAATHE